MKATATIEFDVPEGYTATGEIRCPKQDEYYLYRFYRSRVGEVHKASFDFEDEKYPILRKAEVWVTLTNEATYKAFENQTVLDGLRIKKTKEPLTFETISEMYRSCVGRLCIRASVGGKTNLQVFFPEDLEYLKKTK